MKLKIERVKLWGAMSVLSKVINPKASLPILANVHCLVKDSKLVMTGSDTEVTYMTTLPLLEQEGEGEFCVNAQNLSNALAVLPDQPVVIVTTDDGRFTLQHQSGETFFPIDNSAEYPLTPEYEFTSQVTIPGRMLADAIKRSVWCVAKDDLRPQMCGVCLNVKDGCIDIVASNSACLARTSIDADVAEGAKVILPAKAAKVMAGMVGDEDVTLEINDMFAKLEVGESEVVFRLIEGVYPKYEAVIPTEFTCHATVQRGWLLNALKNTIPFSATQTSMVVLNFEADKLNVKGEDTDFATGATNSFDVEFEGEPLTIGMCGSNLLTLLQNINADEVVIQMIDPSRAIVVEPSEQDDADVLMMSMPMLVKND